MHVIGNSPKSILESMELVRLPSPPHILGKLLDVCHDPESSMADLATIISTDAALTSKLLMAINSAAFGITQPVNNLQHALSLLGHNLIKTMAITSSIQQLFSGLNNNRSEFVCNLWLDSLYCAIFAQDIAQAIEYSQPEEAYLAGLLHDFGQIVFDAKFHKQYLDIINSETEIEAIEKENIEFGIDHAELGACIIEQWPSLNSGIADAARFHHETSENLQGSDILCQILAESSQIAWQWSRFGTADSNWQSQLVSPEQLQKIYQEVNEKVSQTATSLGIEIPEQGGLTQKQLAQNLEQDNIRLAQKVRDNSLINAISQNEMDAFKSRSPRCLLLKIAQELQLIFSISDVALLIDDAEKDFLNLYEINYLNPVTKFPLINNNSHLIQSFKEKKMLWIDASNENGEKAAISDRQIVRRLKHEGAMSLPLMSHKKILGTIIIGVDNVQKSYIQSQMNILTSYLSGSANAWINHIAHLNQQSVDSNEEKEQEQQQLQKLVHEISNPLSVIGNYIEILKKKTQAVEESDNKEIGILKEELERIRNIIANFRNEADQSNQGLMLNAELQNCVPLYIKSFSTNKEVEIHWQLDDSDSKINISKDAFRQIVLNLIKNAVEAQQGLVDITIRSLLYVNINGTNYAQFTISDKGDGIDISTRKMLFSPIISNKQGNNRGVGLSVVAELVNSFHGQIKYLENEFGGASFEVLIPLNE